MRFDVRCARSAVAVGHADHELVVDVRVTGGLDRKFDAIGQTRLGKQRAISIRVLPPAFRPRRQMRRFHAKHRRLQRIEPEIAADPRVVILRLGAVVANERDFTRQRRIVGRDESRVAEGAEILRREEGETAGATQPAGLTRADAGSDRLRGVLDDGNARAPRRSFRCASMSAHNPYRWTGRIARVRGVMARAIASGSALNVTGSISTNTGVAPTRLTHPAVAKNENVGRDDFVAWTDPERHQHRQQCIGP